ncbi:DUF4240 domain-containing protein [Streptomyces ossamyceticus]|nr:DUF4240 domain-containing protein [Streptomyces ossamyceticus]
MDFRAAVIALGCQWYQRVAADPDSLAAHLYSFGFTAGRV